ncbi:transposase [Bradyrhizobium sp. F1.4.3]
MAISTAIGWMKRVDETGSVAPGQLGGHKPKAISGDHAVWVSQRIKDGDFTLRGLFAGRGLKVDYHGVGLRVCREAQLQNNHHGQRPPAA